MACLSSCPARLHTGICGLAPDPALRIFNYASSSLSVGLEPSALLPANQSVVVGKQDSILLSLAACPWDPSHSTTGDSHTALRLQHGDIAQDIYLHLDLARPAEDGGWVRLNRSNPPSLGTPSAADQMDWSEKLDTTSVESQSVLGGELDTVRFPGYWGLQSGPDLDSSTVDLLLFDAIDTERWMSLLPDDTKLSQLVIPGTHETLARYGYPQAKCQNEESTVAAQLEAGIRFMDIRLVAKPSNSSDAQPAHADRLYAYHGKVDERITFDEVLKQVWAFLDGPGSGETLVMSIKSEADSAAMQKVLERAYIAPTRSRWWLDTKVPKLGEARGKIILFSRYGLTGQPDLGLHPPAWPDNLDGLWTYQLPGGETFATQDWFKVRNMGNVGHKWDLVQRMAETFGPQDVYAINYVSGNTSPLAYPHCVSLGWLWWKGLNPRLRDYVSTAYRDARLHKRSLDQLHNFFLLDFYDVLPELVPLLIQANFV